MRKISLIISLLILLVSCHKDQDIMPNPTQGCDCAHEVSADFYLEELTTPNPNFVKYTDTDTIYADKNVRFRAKENEAEYTWYIGAEVLTTQEVTRYFSSALVGQTLTVSLVVKKNPNNICFPNDDGKDSVTRTFYIAPAYDSFDFFNNPQPRFEGTYRMKDSNMSDSIDIIIEAVYFYSSGNLNKVVLKNYNGLGDSIPTDLDGHNYKQFFFDPPYYLNTSYWHHNINGEYELFLDPYLFNPTIKPKYHYFGRKLN